MASMLVSSAVDRGFEPLLGQTKDYKIGICCFSAISLFHPVKIQFKNSNAIKDIFL
jgi:hypothetical protein